MRYLNLFLNNLVLPSTCDESPKKLPTTLALSESGTLYFISNTEACLSPNFDSNPPDEKLNSRIKSALGNESPSC